MCSFGLLYRQHHTVWEGIHRLAWPLVTLTAEENKSTRHTESTVFGGLRKGTIGPREKNSGRGVALSNLGSYL